MELRRVVHDEQAARLEVHVNHAAWRRLRAYRHAPRRAKREERNRKAFANLVQVIVVRGDAVAPVAVQVEADAVERYSSAGNHARGSAQDGWRREGRRRIEPEVGHQPRHVNLAVVHQPALGSPLDAAAQLREPGLGGLRIDQGTRISDPPAFVVGQQPLARVEERQLSHRQSS